MNTRYSFLNRKSAPGP